MQFLLIPIYFRSIFDGIYGVCRYFHYLNVNYLKIYTYNAMALLECELFENLYTNRTYTEV